MHVTITLLSLALVILIAAIIYGIRKYYWEEALFAFILILIVAAVTIVPAQVGYKETGEGDQAGYITSVEHGGIVHKTTTVYIKTNAESSTYHTYCAADPGVISDLREYRDSGQRVVITYSQHLIWGKGCEWDEGANQVIHTVRAV